jgi:hypothetical protein
MIKKLSGGGVSAERGPRPGESPLLILEPPQAASG